MRIKAVHVAGLAVALMSGVAKEALADTTVSNSTTTPLQTSTAGNVTVSSGGTITVTANQSAITVNSNNSVTSGGTLASKDANNSTGILLGNGSTGTISNTGAITLSETYAISDTDGDGDLDGAWAQGSNRFGILLNAGSAFTGNITTSGPITVAGNNSAGISLNAPLIGNFASTGSISLVGDNSVGVHVGGGAAGGITGNFSYSGALNVLGQNSSGIVIDAPISGSANFNGVWVVTGFHSTVRPTDTSKLDADDTLLSGAALAIHSSIGGGVTLQGIGVEDDVDDDGDGITEAAGDTDDDATINITSAGNAPAVLIQADPGSNIVIGPDSHGFGLDVRGNVTAAGIYDNIESHAITILGNGAATTTVQGGIALDFAVTSTAQNADAYGLTIGAGASTPEILQRKSLTVTSVSDDPTHAYGILLDTGANVPTISNTGTFFTQVFGETGTAAAITDRSNTLTTITNTGTLEARLVATDSDTTDNIPPPPITGTAIAVDVSSSTVNVTFNQVADVPFTDDDTVDDDASVRPTIQTIGDLRFGAGADTVNLSAGSIVGDISFGAGADVMNINNGAIYNGRITDSDGALTLNVTNGTIALQGGQTNLTNATFGANAQLGVLLSPTDSTLINASGVVTFASGARIVPLVPAGLPTTGTFTFLNAAGGIVGGSNVTGAVTGTGTPFIYNLTISQTGNSLGADFTLKTATDLGLNANESIAFNPILNALRQDTAASDAFAGLDTSGAFHSAFGQLMPSYSTASTELATTAIQQQQSATTNRLSATRLNNLNETSVWAQEIGYVLDRNPPDGSGGQRFRGHGFGLALGIDSPLNNGALFGISGSFVTSDAEEPVRPDGQISSSFGQGNAYLGAAMGPLDLDFVVGAGVGRMQERRVVEFDSFSATANAQWWAYEGHAIARASAPMRATNWLVMTPSVALTYVGLQEQGYTESGGGAALNLEADKQFSQRLWADVGLEFAGRFSLGGSSVLAPRLYLGYRANALDEANDRQFRFLSTNESFTLTDDKLGSGGPLVGVGVDATNGYSTVSLSYEGEFTDQIDRHSVNVAIRYRF